MLSGRECVLLEVNTHSTFMAIKKKGTYILYFVFFW